MTDRVKSVLIHGALLALAATTAAPLLWMISASLMRPGEASTMPPPLLPASPTLDNYRALFTRLDIGRHLVNSLVISVAITALSVVLNTLAGYAFAKLRFKGRDRLFLLILLALIIPPQVAMLPLFVLIRGFGLVNSIWGVIVPVMAGAFGIYLIRQYALSIPHELLDAARIDGASELRIFASIVLPVCRPALTTLALFMFMGSWNDFMWPLIVLSDSTQQTLPVALAGLVGEHAQDTELMMAGAVLTVLPVLLLFLVMQRHYIRGLTLGSVKG